MTDALLKRDLMLLDELQELYFKLRETTEEIQKYEDNLRSKEAES